MLWVPDWLGMLLKYPIVQRTALNRDVSKMSTGLKKPLSSNPHSPESGGSDPERVGDCHLWVVTGATTEGSLELCWETGGQQIGTRAGLFHANPPTCRIPNTELVARMTQAFPEQFLGQMRLC